MVVFMVLWGTLVYCPLAHWVWGGGVLTYGSPYKPEIFAGGALDFAPASARSSLGIAPNGTLSVAIVGFDGTWRGTDQRRQLDLNRAPVAGHTTLYTSAWGPTTPAESGVVEDVLGSLPPTVPNRIVAGQRAVLVVVTSTVALLVAQLVLASRR